MRRIILTALLGWIVSVSVVADVLTEEQARSIARNFRQSGARSTVHPTLVYTGLTARTGARTAGEPAFYVYNYGADEGFVIVSGDDATLPILAFSDNGQFVAGEQMPVQVASWLDGYCDYIRQVRSGIRYVEPAPDLGLDITVAVHPLMQTSWDQDKPYNNLCPPLGEGENCATGCAATAIAQIMKYHNWPDTGEGSVTFDGKVVDFSQSHYDWENMLDTYDYYGTYPEVQTQAVAQLMSDVGVSVGMLYGYESGAQNVHIYRSLYTHFKYSRQMQYLVRNSMTTAEWKSRIRRELDAGRPVYYGGFADDMSMGHAFVCDGIDESNNYFHFNWGWSGHCNGFYFLNALNPPVLGIGGGAGNFNADHVAIVGIRPAQEGEPDELEHAMLMMRKGFYTNTGQTTLGKSFNAQVGNVWNLGPESVNTKLAVGMYDASGDFVDIVSDVIDLSLPAFFGKSMSVPVAIPQGTAIGKYELRVVCEDDGAGWKEILYYYDCYRHSISLEVDGDEVIVKSPERSEVQLRVSLQQQIPDVLLPGKLYPLQVRFENVGTWNFDGRIGCRLLQLPQCVDGPQITIPDTDTLTVWQIDDLELIYSEDSKCLDVDLRLNASADYLLQAYYNDPLLPEEVLACEWPFTLAEPAEDFVRRVVMEQIWDGGDHQAMQQLSQAYPENLVGITVREADFSDYADSLDLSAGVTALMNRVRNSSFTTAADGESYLKNWLTVPAMASVSAKARYTSVSCDSVELALTGSFAYSANGLDMRFAVVSLVRDSVKVSDSEWIYVNRAVACYPAGAWNGAKGSLPSEVVAGEAYTYTLTLKSESEKKQTFVGLLIDGETGEICNAVSLNQDEIAPMEGELMPVSVNIERREATMNTGLTVQLEADVQPRSASQELVWTSSNPDVAQFDEWGQLKTLVAGTTTIRAASAANPEVYAEMRLTVQAADYSQPQHVEAGYLHYLVDFDSCPDKLTLQGEINGTDIALLRTLSGGDNVVGDLIMSLACPLNSLDISQCRIVKGGKPYYKNYMTENDVVGKEMFKDCLFLREIVLSDSLVAIGDNAFAESGRGEMKTLEIPATVQTIGYAPFYGCQGFEAFTVAEGNMAYKAIDGVLYNYAATELVAYPAAKPDTVYEAVETLTRILPYAFNEACYLKRFSTNLRLSSIGYGAFYNAWNLEVVTLGARLNKVAEYAFAECRALKIVSCVRVNPAECAANAFEGVPEMCLLDLPEGFNEEYRTALGWNHFTHVVTPVEKVWAENPVRVSVSENGISLWSSKPGEPVSVFSPTGVMVAHAETVEGEIHIPLSSSGVYIVCLPGFNIKVVVK